MPGSDSDFSPEKKAPATPKETTKKRKQLMLDENPPLGNDEVAEKEAEKRRSKKKQAKPKELDEDPPLGSRPRSLQAMTKSC